jgi:hypothetical protein
MAGIQRATSEVFGKTPLLKVKNLEVSVRTLEPGSSFVTLATDLSGERTGHAVGGAVMGGGFGGTSALVLGIAVAPAAALIAVPIAAAFAYGWRYGYQSEARKVSVQLESLLDRLEHGELPRRRS